MGWTDVFPVFTEEMVDDFEAQASKEDRTQMEEWYGTERVVNAQPDKPDIVSVSLFWKNVREGDPELPAPTREILQNAQELGFAKRFNPWDHYVKPLLEQVPDVLEKFPDVVVRVYLAKDMEFLAEELAAAGNEVHVMKSSSIHFAPGGLWRFLPFSETGKRVTVTDVDRLNELESDLLRSQTMAQGGLGAWRVPVPIDLTGDRRVCYLPFMGCQFGVQGGLMNVRQLLEAFTWHAINGLIEPLAIFPACGPLEIQGNKWPSYGFDELFMTLAAYPRLAQKGMLTFVPTFSKSQLLTLDIEYVTWGNPNSELVYFPVDDCCGVVREAPQESEPEAFSADIVEFPHGPVSEVPENAVMEEPIVAFLFLTRSDQNHANVWTEYLSDIPQTSKRIYSHCKDREFLPRSSFLHSFQIEEWIDTEWGGLSIVHATVALLEAAVADAACTHFVLISESCVPVRPFHELSHSLQLDPRSRMRVQPWNEVRKWNILKAQHLENLAGIRKELAHFHDQWMCLSRKDAELILKHDRRDSFAGVFAPDEAYFATVLASAGASPLQSLANRAITWTEWEMGKPHPREFLTVRPSTAAQIVDSGCFFARKFQSGSDIGRWELHRARSAAKI